MNKINNHIGDVVPSPHKGGRHWIFYLFFKAKCAQLISFAKRQPREFAIQVITYILLCLWITVASRKVFDYSAFRQAMLDQPFDDSYGGLLSYLLPLIQLGTAVLFIFENTKRYGFLLTILLMIAFSWYIILVLQRTWGIIPCYCTLEFPTDWKGHLWINGIIAVFAIAGLLLDSIKKRTKTSTS